MVWKNNLLANYIEKTIKYGLRKWKLSTLKRDHLKTWVSHLHIIQWSYTKCGRVLKLCALYGEREKVRSLKPTLTKFDTKLKTNLEFPLASRCLPNMTHKRRHAHISRIYIPLSLPTTLSLKLLVHPEIHSNLCHSEQITSSHFNILKTEVKWDKHTTSMCLYIL